MGIAMGNSIWRPRKDVGGSPIGAASVLCEPGWQVYVYMPRMSRTGVNTKSNCQFNMGMETEHKFCIIVGGGMCGIAVGAHLVKKKILPSEDFRLLDKL